MRTGVREVVVLRPDLVSRRWSIGERGATVEVAPPGGAVAMFGALGFHAEGLLRDHVRVRHGELRDLVLLAHPIDDHRSAMETAGTDDAIASS